MDGELILADERVSQSLLDLLSVKQCLYGILGEEAAYDVIAEMDMLPSVESKLDWGLDLLEFLVNGEGGVQNTLDQSKTPVDPETFLLDPYFLGKEGEVYPEVLKAYLELSNGTYDEAVMTGGIGSGKTQLALYALAYQLYLLSCLTNPQNTFGLDSSSEVKMVFQSLRKSTATDVDYARFKHMIEQSPYFRNEYPHNANLTSKMEFPNRVLLEPLSGSETAAIGQNIIGGLIDEINFMAVVENSKQATDGGVYNQAIELYNSIARRRKTRFMAVGGRMAGLLCVVSSKKVPEEFTDQKMKEAKTNPRIFVYDKRVWDVKPEAFCGETFKLFIGDNTRRPFLVEAGDRIAASDYHLIDEIPIEFLQEFQDDLVKSVRDIAGHTTLVTTPFFTNTEKVLLAFGKSKNISKYDFVDFYEYPCELIKSRIKNTQFPRYAHVDLALTQDSAGVSIGHVPAFKNVKQTLTEGESSWTLLPHVVADLVLEVKPPKKGEIPFDKIRSLLITLRDKLGLPIKWVSFDSYQSRDSMQILRRHGFECGLLSVDTSMEPYIALKTAINDERCDLPAHAKAQKEAVALEVDYKAEKVDHNALNSKDVTDSLAGMVYGLTQQKAVWLQHGVSWQKTNKSK